MAKDFKSKDNLKALTKALQDAKRRKVKKSEVKRVIKEVGSQFVTNIDNKAKAGPLADAAKSVKKKADRMSKQVVKRASTIPATQSGRAVVKKASGDLVKVGSKEITKHVGKGVAKEITKKGLGLIGKAAIGAGTAGVTLASEAASAETTGNPRKSPAGKLQMGDVLTQEERLNLGSEDSTKEPKDKKSISQKMEEERIKLLMNGGMTRTQAEMKVIKEEDNRQKENINKAREDENASRAANEETFNDLVQEEKEIQEAIELGSAQGKDVSNLESRLSEIQKEKESIQSNNEIAGPPEMISPPEAEVVQPDENPNAAADASDVQQAADASEPTKQDLADKATELKDEQVEIESQKLAQENIFKEQKRQIAASIEKLESENKELEAIDPNRFWNNASTFGKVMMVIGAIADPISGYARISGLINQDIANQRMERGQILSRRQHALKLVGAELDRAQQMTDNDFRRQKLDIMKNKNNIEIAKINNERMIEAKRIASAQGLVEKLSSSKGLTREELNTIDVNPDNSHIKANERAVWLKDGKARLANNPKQANKLNQEVLPQMSAAVRDLKRLKQIAEENPLGGKFGIFTTRPESKVLIQSVIGNLRLELFGPGVLTDTEQRLARGMIGKSADFTQMSAAVKTSLSVLIDKLKYGMKEKLRFSGVQVPKSTNDKRIDQMMKVNKKLTKPEVIDALVKSGKWDAEDGI